MWQGLFQLSLFKSVATLACGGLVFWFASMGVANIECAVAKPPPPTFFPGQPTFDPTGPPTTADGCQTYGSFLLLPANNAPFILGLLAAVAGWLGETAYKEHQAKKEIPRPPPR
jgi:hypothetical protein